MSVVSKIPVKIVTGFLGAGKTTLLQRLVRECEGLRIAVIQNEVSEEMGIESAVLTDSSGAIIPDFFELPNGCICCTAKDDMIITLENIVNIGRERIDYIIVETTGIADPCMVAEIFWLDNELGSHIFLDGIVTVVDAMNFEKTIVSDNFLNHSKIGRRQIAIADRIILNKCDLLVNRDTTHLIQLIKSFNPVAEIQTVEKSAVLHQSILNIASFDSSKLSLFPTSFHGHVESVDHVFLTFDTEFDLKVLELQIGIMLWEKDFQIYRAKGLFKVGSEWYGLQAVGALFETTPQPAAQTLGGSESKFLFVGANLNKEQIIECLTNAIIL